MQKPERTVADRLRRQIRGSHSRTYWLTVLVVAAIGLAVALLQPARRRRPVFDRPTAPIPEFQVFRIDDVSGEVERLNLAVLVRPGTPDGALRACLDWALYMTLDDYNRRQKRRVRVIWAYAVEDSAVPLSRWRALAIWADPDLPERLQPAHSGGDAARVGSVEYDFTNPLRESSTAGHRTSVGRWS